ncbi:MAG: ABC-F family ATP-binding cassette domain-containing protein [Spirochaetaceae bacterium]|jgi:ATP-binding cassette subfamily F protein 3|nr:ABC-F family ATP-binding cassette domain-containing protein [Spirochaetaceae bacterium]
MAFLQANSVSLAFGDRDILKQCTIFLKDGSKAALAGANGSGKTTLLSVLAGRLQADSGECILEKNARAVYLPQSGVLHHDTTLAEEADTAFDHIRVLLAEAARLGDELAGATQDDAKTAALLEAQHRLTAIVEESGYYFRQKRSSEILVGLGFSESDFSRQCEEFSGGWQMRIALAKVLLSSPDIMLLDEPTNYLDIEARFWLEDYLGRFKGAYLLVSHDRYFLDTTINEVYELFQGTLTRYSGNYSAYEKRRATELESLTARYRAQQEEIAKTEDLIRRFRYKASKAAMVQERIKMLARMERIELPENLHPIAITLPSPPHSGRIALALEGVCRRYGTTTVLNNVDITLEAGERLVVAGRNGAGKTTLLRIIAGVDPQTEGTVRYGSGISVGYFNQDTTETITGNDRILDYLEAQSPTALIPKLRDMLGAFLFRGDDVYKNLNVLSGGEKARLALLALLLRPVNLLVLDEPTNHLDLSTKDILLNALLTWSGTIVFVSHDRAFMEALSTKTLELRSGSHTLYYGNYAYYIEKKALEGFQDGLLYTATPQDAGPQRGGCPEAASPALFREQRKQEEAQRRRREREEAALVEEIESLEARKIEFELQLSQPEVYSSGEKSKKAQTALATLNNELDKAIARWEALVDSEHKPEESINGCKAG